MKPKVIRQHDERDCGAACLATIAAYYEKNISLPGCRELCKTDKNGTTIYGICEGAKAAGFEAEGLTGSPDSLISELNEGKITFPFIAHTIVDEKAQHFIVVFEIANNKVLIGDPAHGKMILSEAEFYSNWTGNIIAIRPGVNFKKDKNSSSHPLERFKSLIFSQKKKFIGIISISLIVALIGIAGSFVFEIVMDNFSTSNGYYDTCDDDCTEDHEHVYSDDADEEQNIISSILSDISQRASDYNVIFIAMIGLYLISALIQYIRGRLIIDFSKKIDVGLSESYFNHIIDLPVQSISVRKTGEYMTRFADISTIRNAISNATLTLILDTAMAVGCGIVLFMQNHMLFLISLIMIAMYAIVVLAYHNPLGNANRSQMECEASVQSYMKESLDGAETVKSANAGNKIKSRFHDKFNKFMNAIIRNSRMSMSQDVTCTTIELIGTIIIIWIGFSLVLSGAITIGALITFYMLLQYFTEPVKNLISLQPTIQTALIAAERLDDVMDMKVEQDDAGENEFPKAVSKWEVKDVNFRYGNRELTLNGISMCINKGEKIAIVGESGSGKTTLANLLIGAYAPEAGEITADDLNYNQFRLSDIRSQVAYVNQDTFLFSESIKNGLRLTNPSATDDEIRAACEISKASEFIDDLPMKYDTILDENGANLSGGQRQRLAIARALLKHPQLLILDEATSNLDTITESSIKDTIFNLNDGLTCIVIAHRLSTIRNCDRIYVMDKGRFTECGTHEELMAKNGRYTELWNRQ